MVNQINFTGTFLIKQPKKQTKRELDELLKDNHGKVIYHSFNNKRNSIYVLRDNLDSKFASYVIDNKLNFDYYPSVSTANLVEDTSQQHILELLQANKEEKVKAIATLRKMFPAGPRSKANYETAIDRTFKLLKLDKDKYNISRERGVVIVSDKKGKTVARTSPVGQYGLNFVHIEPEIVDLPPKRYAINSDGNAVVEYKSFKGVEQFMRNFEKAIEYNS